MTVALSRHFENLRTVLSCYTKNGACTAARTNNWALATGAAPNSNNKVHLLRTTQANETRKINTNQFILFCFSFHAR